MDDGEINDGLVASLCESATMEVLMMVRSLASSNLHVLPSFRPPSFSAVIRVIKPSKLVHGLANVVWTSK